MEMHTNPKFCERCNIEHPPINGLLQSEIVRESHRYSYRKLEFEIWIIESINSHFWSWSIPVGKTKGLVDKILHQLNYSIPSFNEGYSMPSYLFREMLKSKEVAFEAALKSLREISDSILDALLPSEEKKVRELKQALQEFK